VIFHSYVNVYQRVSRDFLWRFPREVYDFIIFRGQDIKDLTVLEGQGKPSSVPLLHSGSFWS
jgi:hypothetical protein